MRDDGESVRMEEIGKRKREGKFRKNKRIASLILECCHLYRWR